MELTSIKPHYEIRFRDIDPDTGDISQDMPIAMTMSEQNANWIRNALTYEWFSEDGPNDPNREFYVYKQKEIKL
jgi:hypothetical protein